MIATHTLPSSSDSIQFFLSPTTAAAAATSSSHMNSSGTTATNSSVGVAPTTLAQHFKMTPHLRMHCSNSGSGKNFAECDEDCSTSKTSISTASTLSTKGSSRSHKSHGSKGSKRSSRNRSPSLASTSTTTILQREVRFAGDDDSCCAEIFPLDDVPAASQMTDEERAMIWWSQEQVDNFRKNTSKVAKKSLPQSHKKVLSELHRICQAQGAAEGGGNADMGDVSDLLEGQRSLVTWVVKNCRGLEKRTVSEWKDEARARKTMLVDAINMLQRSVVFDAATKADKIKFCSERLSASSRCWARAMGLADFMARLEEEACCDQHGDDECSEQQR